jgi:peptidoglycan/LPS O-acetylase OafA/YrhL
LEKHLLLFFPFLQNFVSPHPDFFTEAWSLSVEEYAYLILPLLMFSMFVLFRNIPKHKVFLYATLISILVLVIPKLNFYFNHSFQDMTDWSSGYRKVVLYRLDSIYLGFLVVYLMKYFNSLFIRMRTLLLWSGLVLFAGLHLTILMFKLDPENYAGFFVWVYLQTVMLSLALIFPYFATLHSGILKKLVIFVSLRSYAMYLVNYSIVLLTLQRIADFQLVTLKGKIGFLLLYLLISTGISMLIYTYFEKPILRYRDNNIKRI